MQTRSLVSLLCLATATAAAGGCIPHHEYQGEYDMTYDVIMSFADGRQDARAGTTLVEVNDGLNNEYLLDLGPTLCRVEGTYVEAVMLDDWPHLDIPPQDCWFTMPNGKEYSMMVTGTASRSHDEDERLEIVLSGNFVDPQMNRGSATVELTESW
jgi:hypothetical protein